MSRWVQDVYVLDQRPFEICQPIESISGSASDSISDPLSSSSCKSISESDDRSIPGSVSDLDSERSFGLDAFERVSGNWARISFIDIGRNFTSAPLLFTNTTRTRSSSPCLDKR